LQGIERKTFSVLFAVMLLSSVVSFIPSTPAYSQTTETDTINMSAVKDSFIRSGAKNTNEGANTILQIQSTGNNRAVIAFDNNDIINAVDGRQLISATLHLYVIDSNHDWGTKGRTIEIHKITGNWIEGNGVNFIPRHLDEDDEPTKNKGTGYGVTWSCSTDSNINNKKSNCDPKWNGGNFDSSTSDSVLITSKMMNQFIDFDVTADVQSFLDGSANNGWLIKKTLEKQNGRIEFASRESTSNSPVLELVVQGVNPIALSDEYSQIIARLNNINNVTDESILTDYLTQTMSNLRTDTASLVSDPESKQNLATILNVALNSARSAGIEVIAINEDGANLHINEARSHIQDYIAQVKTLSGNTIPDSTADILISKATLISDNSLKRGIDTAELTTDLTLDITSQLIYKINVDLDRLRQIVLDFQSIGFQSEVTTQRNSPTKGVVTFKDQQSSQQFRFIIPDGTLSIFIAMGIYEENNAGGIQLSTQDISVLLVTTPDLVYNFTNLSDDEFSRQFVFAGVTPYSSVVTSVIITITNVIAICPENPECDSAVTHIFAENAQEKIHNLFNRIFPRATISGFKFNDLNTNGIKENNEPFLEGWKFNLFAGYVQVATASSTTDSNGQFLFSEVRIPAIVKTIVLQEDLNSTLIQQGWTSTTGLVKDIPFTPPNLDEVFTSEDNGFGNANLLVPKPATLIVINKVINDEAGTLSSGDFTLHVTGNEPSPAEFTGVDGTVGSEIILTADLTSVGAEDGYLTMTGPSCAFDPILGVSKNDATVAMGPRLWNPNISAASCHRAWTSWNVSSIPDGAKIIDTKFTYQALIVNTAGFSNAPRAGTIYSLEHNPVGADPTTLRTDIRNGTQYVVNDPSFNELGIHTIDLGPLADAALESNLANGWFGIGISHPDESTSVFKDMQYAASEDTSGHIAPKLSVTYIPPGTGTPTTGGVTVTLQPGAFAVSEDTPITYTVRYEGDCTGEIASGETNTCVVINEDRPEIIPVVFEENFDDGNLDGWNGFGCFGGACFTSTTTDSAAGPAPSAPYWGVIGVIDSTPSTNCNNFGQVFYQRTFDVIIPGNYNMKAHISLYPGPYVITTLSMPGVSFSERNVAFPTNFLRLVDTTVHLDPGTYPITLGMQFDGICSGSLTSTYDDISVTLIP